MATAAGSLGTAGSLLERACEMRIPVTLGDDSHGPEDVGVGLDACLQAIERAGYRRIHYFTGKGGEVHLESAPLESVRRGLQG